MRTVRSRAAEVLQRLGLGLFSAAAILACLEVGLRIVWRLTGGPPTDATVVVRNRFAPGSAEELPIWFWSAMAPAQRSNVVGNAMAYPDPDYIFRVRPNPTGRPVLGFAGINALGFRTAHLDGSLTGKEPGRPLRILHLGDSCAWGWGVREFDQTMAPEIERRLAAASIPVEVVNLAEPGFTSTQGLKLFGEWFPRLRPAFVVLQYGWNDRRNSRGFTDRQVMEFLPILHSRPVKAVMKTTLYRTFSWAAASLLPGPPNPAYGDRDLDPVVDNEHMRVPLKESIANYRAMIDQSKAAGAKVLIVLPPYKPSVSGLGPRIHDFNRGIADTFRGEVTFVALPAMREPSSDLDAYFDPDGIHPNLRGVEYMAEAIATQIALDVHQNDLVAGRP